MLTKEEFEALTPFQKGYAVYMAGSRDDEPNIPANYSPIWASPQDKADFEAGQLQAVLEVQDCP